MVLFEVSWLASSRQFGCPGEKALAKLKVFMLDGLDNHTLVVIQTNIEDKVDETAIPYRHTSLVDLSGCFRMAVNNRDRNLHPSCFCFTRSHTTLSTAATLQAGLLLTQARGDRRHDRPVLGRLRPR
jgi:hypothetical protein